jgi:hypothetical protein
VAENGRLMRLAQEQIAGSGLSISSPTSALYELYSSYPHAPGVNVLAWNTPSLTPQPSHTSMTPTTTARIAASASILLDCR